MSAREQIQALTKTLEEANYHYYVLDDPQMEDYEYDRLLRQLEELEAPASGAGVAAVPHKAGGRPGTESV